MYAPPSPTTKCIAIISMSKSNAASASHRNRCWRAKSYHWQPPVSGAIAADRGSLASAYNCFAESRQDPLVPTVAQASLDDCTAPVVQGALLQNSCMQRQAHRDRRRWRLKPAVSSDRLSRASSDSDAMHFARLQPFFSDCFYFQRARILSDSRSNIEILSDSRSNLDLHLLKHSICNIGKL